MQTALSAVGLTKRFPGVTALDRIDFHARNGEVHALMGENGAGKSTLIKVLTGVYAHDDGDMFVDGKPIRPISSPLLRTQSTWHCPPFISCQSRSDPGACPVAENIIPRGGRPKRQGRSGWH